MPMLLLVQVQQTRQTKQKLSVKINDKYEKKSTWQCEVAYAPMRRYTKS